MTYNRPRLTQLAVNSLSPREKRYDVWDDTGGGFGIRVFPSGTKSYFVYWRDRGKLIRQTLGRHPDLTVKQARQLARDIWHEAYYRNLKPFPMDEETGPLFGEALPQYLAEYCAPNNKPSTLRSTTLLLEREFLPPWRDVPVTDITLRHIHEVLEPIIARGSPGAAEKARIAITTFFKWCLSRDMVKESPCLKLRTIKRSQQRSRVLDDHELKLVWQATKEQSWPFREIVQLLTLTMQRRSEITKLEWSHLDWSRNAISLPPELTKNRQPHIVPMSSTVIELIRGLPVVHERFLFPLSSVSTSVTD